MSKQLLTIYEVAFLLQISNQTVRKLIKSHKLIAIKIGHIYRITWNSVEQFMQENKI